MIDKPYSQITRAGAEANIEHYHMREFALAAEIKKLQFERLQWQRALDLLLQSETYREG